MYYEKIDPFQHAIGLDMRNHQAAGKRHYESLIFTESLKFLEENLEHPWIEKIDEMMQELTSKAQAWYRANKYGLNFDIYYSELKVLALRKLKCKIYQLFRLKGPFSH